MQDEADEQPERVVRQKRVGLRLIGETELSW